MRVAMLCPYLPAPPVSGGRIRMFELARGLAEEHEVVLFAAAGQSERQNPTAQASLEIYSRVYAKLNRWRRLPIWYAPRKVLRLAALRADFRAEHAKDPFALTVVEHSYAAGPAIAEKVPFLVDEHNIESDYFRAHDSALKAPTWRDRREHALLRTWERKVWRRAKTVVCISDTDAAVVRGEVPATPVLIVPNGVDWQGIPFRPPSQRTGQTVLFVGLMSHPPNIAAAQMLMQDVMPRVWHDHPAAKLVLCGHNPVPEIAQFAGPHVEVTGTVSSVQPYLDTATVIVNPVRHGAGTSLKVLEALASGAPLVTTTIGVRGYDEQVVGACLIADTADEMAKAIARCLDGPGDDARAERGRAASADFDWVRLAARFRDRVRACATR